MGYYDLVLGLIPASFLGVTGFLSAAGIELTAAVPVAALFAGALVAHALFVRAPVEPTERRPVASTD